MDDSVIIRRMASCLALTLGAALALNGCDNSERAPSTVTVRDSAGITIVDNGSGAVWREGEGWRLSADPVVDIGVFEGDEAYQLHDATDALRLSDGRIVVANGGTHELRFYAADGGHLRSVGREGGGPGEFQRISGVDLLAGDTISAWDWNAVRMSTFAPDGDFVRSVSPMLAEQGFAPQSYGTFSDGSFVIRPSIIPSSLMGQGDGLRRDTSAYTRYDGADGALLDTVAVTPGEERYVQSRGDGFSIATIPFARGPRFAVYGDHAYIGVNDRFDIRVLDASSALQRIIRLTRNVTPVTDAAVRLYAEDNAADRLPPQERDDPGAVGRMVQTILGMPRPETFPLFDALAVDDVGVLWVREYDQPGAEGPRHWIVFDGEGRLLGTVQTPRELEVFQIGRDFVLGHARDDLDIEHIRLYELIRSPD